MQLLWWMAASWGSFCRFSLAQEEGKRKEMGLFRAVSVKKPVVSILEKSTQMVLAEPD